MVGDGSYLMLNSEIATSVMLGLQADHCDAATIAASAASTGCSSATGGAAFNNLLEDRAHEVLPEVDFVAHARTLGAAAEKVASIAELGRRSKRPARRNRPMSSSSTPTRGSTDAGGYWWEVAVPEVSVRAEVRAARRAYEDALQIQRLGTEMSIRIGANPIGWTNDDMQEIGGDTPLETCLAEAREAGVVGMEKGHKLPNDGAALKDKLAAFDLTFVSGWYSPNC